MGVTTRSEPTYAMRIRLAETHATLVAPRRQPQGKPPKTTSGGGGDVDVEQNGGVKVVKSRKRRGEIAHGQATECSKRQRGQVAEVGGIRRSKRLAERAGDGTEHDTEHAHQRKRHEGVSKAVCDTVEPWRDK